MKRSEINALIHDAHTCFAANGWALPRYPTWDVTDFGLGDWRRFGLVLLNLADEPEYCEKLMYAKRGMTTPAHAHLKKKEDIIARWGTLKVTVWPHAEEHLEPVAFEVKVNGYPQQVQSGETISLSAGERITLVPGVYHEFVPATLECIIGEISTANDDLHDNVFVNASVGRFPRVDEDEPRIVRLLSDL